MKIITMPRIQLIRGSITAAAILLMSTAGLATARNPHPPVPNAAALKFDQQFDLPAYSKPITVGTEKLSVVKIGRGTFHLDDQGHLTGTLKGGVLQFHKMTYWIHAAVFDATGDLLGVAAHKLQVRNIRTGSIITLLAEMPLDFGISDRFKSARYVAASVSDRTP